jgi:hypothetical protein
MNNKTTLPVAGYGVKTVFKDAKIRRVLKENKKKKDIFDETSTIKTIISIYRPDLWSFIQSLDLISLNKIFFAIKNRDYKTLASLTNTFKLYTDYYGVAYSLYGLKMSLYNDIDTKNNLIQD